MPDDENKPGSDDGWADTDRYEVDITLPDGSLVTQSTSPTGEGPVESSLTDSEGNPVRSWDSEERPDEYPPNEMSGDELQRWFDDQVVDTPEFKDSATALNKWGPSGWGEDNIRWTAHVLDFNDRLQCGLEDLGRMSDPLLAPTPVSDGRPDRDVDWSFAFGRLSLGAQRELHDGWTRQYPRQLAEPTWFGAKAMEWFRRSPVMATVILVFGTAVIVVPIVLFSLDDDPVQVDAEFTEPPAEAETETPADEQAFAPIPSGTTEIIGVIDSACGGLYTVFLRAMAFNNQQTTVDQLDVAGGNPFQTASGWGNGRISIVTGRDTSFYEVWLFLWNLGEILSVYNVYGTSADFTAPESAEDVARFESVQSPEDLLAAVNGSPDSCAAEMMIESADFSAFPEANS